MPGSEMELIFKTAADLTCSLIDKKFDDDPKTIMSKAEQIKRTAEIFKGIATELRSVHSQLKS